MRVETALTPKLRKMLPPAPGKAITCVLLNTAIVGDLGRPGAMVMVLTYGTPDESR